MLTPLLAACSLAGTEEVFGKEGSGDGSGGERTGSSGDGATGGDSTSSGDPSTTGGGGTSTSTAASSSAAMSSASSSSGGGDQPEVYCAGAPCAAGEVCCFHESNPNQDHCGGSGTCGAQFIELTCNGPEDCPGQTCCGEWTGSYYTSVMCAPTCNSVIVCGETPAVCDGGLNCEQSGFLGVGYNVCK